VLAAGYGRGCLARSIATSPAEGGRFTFLETVRLKIWRSPTFLPFGGPGILMNVNIAVRSGVAEAILRARRG